MGYGQSGELWSASDHTSLRIIFRYAHARKVDHSVGSPGPRFIRRASFCASLRLRLADSLTQHSYRCLPVPGRTKCAIRTHYCLNSNSTKEH
jgi:hypothetical protein